LVCRYGLVLDQLFGGGLAAWGSQRLRALEVQVLYELFDLAGVSLVL